jgi:transposase
MMSFLTYITGFFTFEEISIFSNGSHLGYKTVLTKTILKGHHQRIISAKFGAFWLDISSNGQKLLYFKPESAKI